MNALLLQAALSLFLPLGAAATAQSAVEDVPPQETKTEQTVGPEEYGVYSAAGLVTIGGAGAIIISQNSKKKKNVPSAELRREEKDDYET